MSKKKRRKKKEEEEQKEKENEAQNKNLKVEESNLASSPGKRNWGREGK